MAQAAQVHSRCDGLIGTPGSTGHKEREALLSAALDLAGNVEHARAYSSCGHIWVTENIKIW